ncbi:GFA family protein [Luteimonas sp. RIT-PG2_3]|jgi:hypothetical protein
MPQMKTLCQAMHGGNAPPGGYRPLVATAYAAHAISAPIHRSGSAMQDTHVGSCLCGSVRFQMEGSFDHFYLCHCAHCRKDTGSAHAANLFSSAGRLQWTAGEDNVITFRLPGTRHARCFCSTCGSALPYAGDGMVVVPAGCLDTAPGIAPEAHLFTASRACWDRQLADLPAFETFPSRAGHERP